MWARIKNFFSAEEEQPLEEKKPSITPPDNSVLVKYLDPDISNLVQALIDFDDQTIEDPQDAFQFVDIKKDQFESELADEKIVVQELEPDDIPVESYEWIVKEEAQAQFNKVAAEKKQQNTYPETEPQWPVPAILKQNKWWCYKEVPSQFVCFNGCYYNSYYLEKGIFAGRIVVGVTLAGPNTYFSFTATGNIPFGVLCAIASAGTNVLLLWGTIPRALAGAKEWQGSFNEHPIRAPAIGMTAICGAFIQGFLTNESFKWAPAPLRIYMISANFIGFLFIRGYGLNNAAKRYDEGFAPLSPRRKMRALFRWQNALALGPAMLTTLVFGSKCDEAFRIIAGNSWMGLPIALRGVVNTLLPISNTILYAGQIQQLPDTLNIAYQQVATDYERHHVCSIFLKPGMLFAINSLSCLSGLRIAHSGLFAPNFYLSKQLTDEFKTVAQYGFMSSVGLINAKLLTGSLYPAPVAKKDIRFEGAPYQLNSATIKKIPSESKMLDLAEIKPIANQNPHLLFAYGNKPQRKKSSAIAPKTISAPGLDR